MYVVVTLDSLHHLLLTITSLEELSLQELRALCEKSDIHLQQVSGISSNEYIYFYVCEYILHISVVISCRPTFHLFHVLH